MDTLPFTTSQVLELLGYSLRPQDHKQTDIDCPFCRKRKKLNFNLERGVFRCNACGITGNNITFFANLMGESNKDAYHDICERLNINNPVSEKEKKIQPRHVEPPVKEVELAGIETLNKTYQCFDYELSLSMKHNDDLRNRGFSQEFIYDKGYKSYPASKDEQEKIIFELQKQGCDLKGVAGFYFDAYTKKWCMSYSKDGIFVKYIDFNNRIQGMQIRIDDEILEEDENKYKWFSSRYKNEGCGNGSLVHYACDFAWDKNNKIYKPLTRNDTFVLTEGALKANLFFHLTGQPAIAIAGVNCTKNLKIELKKLKSIGIQKIIIAYDMDFVKNIHVMKALGKIQEIIKECEMQFSILLWDKTMLKKDGTELDIPIVQDNKFNMFVFTPKTFQKAEEEKNVSIILQELTILGIKNIAFAFQDNKPTDSDTKSYMSLYNSAKEFRVFPVIWQLKYKGIDDYYCHKIREM